MTLRRFLTFTFRGAALRCPRCGGGGILRSWFKLKHECPTCGLVLDRGETDYWYGGYAVNFVAAEFVGVAIIVAFIYFSWPKVNWTLVQWGAPVVVIVVPILFFPFSRTLWLAWDLCFRPQEPGDMRGVL
jgi:uncharacterized protein (DUF983 family)